MKKLISAFKELNYYWIAIIGNTILFEGVGILRYYNGGYNWSGKLELYQSIDLWIWGTFVFIASLILGLIFIPKINRKQKAECIKSFQLKNKC